MYLLCQLFQGVKYFYIFTTLKIHDGFRGFHGYLKLDHHFPENYHLLNNWPIFAHIWKIFLLDH